MEEAPSEEFDIISEVLQVQAASATASGSGGTLDATKAEERERRKLQEEEKNKKISSTMNSNISVPRNVEEAHTNMEDPLTSAKLLEKTNQQETKSPRRPTQTQQQQQQHGEEGEEAEAIDPLHLAKIVEARLSDCTMCITDSTSMKMIALEEGSGRGGNMDQSNNNNMDNSSLSVPGAYLGAPGSALQRTSDLRFSGVGRAASAASVAAAEMKSSVTGGSVTVGTTNNFRSSTSSILNKSTTNAAAAASATADLSTTTLQATLVNDEDNAEKLRFELDQIRAASFAAPIAEVVKDHDENNTIISKTSFMIAVAIFVVMMVGTLIVVILWPIVFM